MKVQKKIYGREKIDAMSLLGMLFGFSHALAAVIGHE